MQKRFDLSSEQFAEAAYCESLDYLHSKFGHSSGFVIGHQVIDSTFLQRFPKLRVIAKYGVGLDNISFEQCQKSSVDVLYQQGVNRHFVAEHTLGLILSTMRRLHKSDLQLRQGIWHRDGGRTLFGKTVGIVGFGNIGRSLAELLTPFKCKIIFHDIIDLSEVGKALQAEQVSLEDIKAQSDVISMHVPLTDLTLGMCGDSFFNTLREGVVFINTARGKIFAPDALVRALKSGHVFAAACDVFPQEPYYGELTQLENFIATPHIAANCLEAKWAMSESAISLLKSHFEQKHANERPS